MADPDCPKTKDDRQNDVSGRAKPVPFHGRIQSLQTERRKRRVTPTKAGHECDSPFRPNQEAAFRSGVGRKKSDYDATAYVHEQRPVRKRLAETPAADAGHPIAGDASQRPSASHEPVFE